MPLAGLVYFEERFRVGPLTFKIQSHKLTLAPRLIDYICDGSENYPQKTPSLFSWKTPSIFMICVPFSQEMVTNSQSLSFPAGCSCQSHLACSMIEWHVGMAHLLQIIVQIRSMIKGHTPWLWPARSLPACSTSFRSVRLEGVPGYSRVHMRLASRSPHKRTPWQTRACFKDENLLYQICWYLPKWTRGQGRGNFCQTTFLPDWLFFT